MDFQTIIGLEIHVELSTESKMFCGCSTAFGSGVNTQTCPVCLGLPGSLPVINEQAVANTIMIGLALNCDISASSVFDRKNYFYPDMSKDYQISQNDIPLTRNGYLDVEMEGYTRHVGINRVHLEEDTGKSLHVGDSGRIHGADFSLIDYNRAGIPLAEIVSEPDLRSPAEARAFLQLLHSTLRYLDISDCKMEEGSLRCDANISIAQDGVYGTKVEIKNMNSFRALFRALTYEEERQRNAIRNGEKIHQETRHWDDAAGKTHSLRSKEEANDYRYFPDPDLLPVEPDPAWIDRLRASLPELPAARLHRFEKEYGVTGEIAETLVAEKPLADYFEEAVQTGQDPHAIAKWITGDLAAILNEASMQIDSSPLAPGMIGELVELVSGGAISGKMAKDVLRDAFDTGESPKSIVEKQGLAQIADSGELEAMVEKILEANPEAASDLRNGKDQALKFLMGQVMKESRGKANPAMATELIRQKVL